jgi:hypothetical protein
MSVLMLYASCVNAASRDWHRERDRDRQHKQQLRRRHHLYHPDPAVAEEVSQGCEYRAILS